MNRLQFVLAILLLFVSCSDGTSTPSSAQRDGSNKKQPKAESTRMTGKELYMQNCAGCHGRNGNGNPPDIPSIVNVTERKSRSFIHDRIKNGKGVMPPFPYLSRAERRAVIDFLSGNESESVASNGASLEEQGKRLFKANCSRCHQATTDDPRPTGIPSEHPMTPAPMAGVTERFSRKKLNKILNRGPGVMPTFRHLSEQSRKALWAYFQTLEGKGEPEGATMLERHPGMLGERHPGTDVPDHSRKPNFSIKDVSEAIHRYIENSMHLNDGYVAVRDKKKQNLVKLTELVRVHEDRLSRVTSDRYFACVDMKSNDGTLYDIDFFLEPSGGELTVTESSIHKVAGRLRYRWVQKNGLWKRKEVEKQ